MSWRITLAALAVALLGFGQPAWAQGARWIRSAREARSSAA